MVAGQPFPGIPRSRWFPVVASVLTALAVAGCGGSTSVTSVVGPDGVRCQTTVSAQPATVPHGGGRVTVTVDAARDCTWTASSDVPWVQLDATSGQGSGNVAATVAANDRGAPRAGSVAINDQRVTVSQEARPCTYEFRVAPDRLSPAGGRGSIRVETFGGCAWTAATSASWLRIVSTASGDGAGTVEFEATPNSGAPREDSILIAGRAVRIAQDGVGAPACLATFSPPSVSAPAAGGTFPVAIGIDPACDWTAASSAPWIALAPPAAGRGSGTTTLVVALNTGAARTGFVTVGTQQLAVDQAAAPICTATIAPAARTFAASGGAGTVTVTTPGGCGWTASTGAGWIAITTSAGTGSGEARYTVSPNTAPSARTATVSVAGQTHTVTQQAAACSYEIVPASASFPAAGGEGRVRVTTAPGCQWSVGGGASWVNVSTPQGSGPGEAVYAVQANGGAAPRTTSLTIAGRNHAIAQEGAPGPSCTYRVQPASASFGAQGGDGLFDVITESGCDWSASSGAGWVTVNTPAGRGTGQVGYRVAANGDPSPRSTTIVVNGQAHAVSQAAATVCTFSVQPGSASFGDSGGSGQFAVVTDAGCAWTVTGGGPWIAVGGAQSGSGPAQVSYTVAPNPDTSPRSAALAVNGQQHVVTQAGAAPPEPCSYSVTPGRRQFDGTGGSDVAIVTTAASCQWTASASASWITLSAASGTGSGEVRYTIAPNSGDARQATITIAGQSFTVEQAEGDDDL